MLGYLHSANIEIDYQLEFSGCCTGTSTAMILCQREMRSLAFFLGLCKIFEEHLKRVNPGKAQITYDIAQLFDFIDQLTDLCCLV